jgi:hypothetical protein
VKEYPGKIAVSFAREVKWIDSENFESCEPAPIPLGYTQLPSLFACAACDGKSIERVSYFSKGADRITFPELDRTIGGFILRYNSDSSLAAIRRAGPYLTLVSQLNGRAQMLQMPVADRTLEDFRFSPVDPACSAGTLQRYIAVYEHRNDPDYVARMQIAGCEVVHDVWWQDDHLWTVSSINYPKSVSYQIRRYDSRQTLQEVINVGLPEKFVSSEQLRPKFVVGSDTVQLIMPGVAWAEVQPNGGLTFLHTDEPEGTLPKSSSERQLGVNISHIAIPKLMISEPLKNTVRAIRIADSPRYYVIQRKPDHSGGEVLNIFDAATEKIENSWDNQIEDILTGNAVLKQEGLVGEDLICGCEDGHIRIFNQKAQVIGRLNLEQQITAIETRNGRFLTGDSSGNAIWGTNLNPRDRKTWKVVDERISSAAMLDDNIAVFGHFGGGLSLWRLDSEPQLLMKLPTGSQPAESMRCSPDGQMFAVMLQKAGVVHLWSIPKLRQALREQKLDW